ncbi:MAG: cbb3-type cytochrome c oxidase subunit 3 [Proteobacteria bacterium]|nr:cbb3-type cytochrome c oxidase subunit 3 [Pseudomonadota bacterium]MBU1737890.1 cbb3-type cytochrome c oxidase subunit 3 [Pseudomonadota bacterium]
MNMAGYFYLGTTFGLFLILAIIIFRTYRKGRKKELENPKYRMLDDD